jgi:fatty acid desaturase
MDTRPQLLRETPRRRPSLGEILPPLLVLVGATALLASIVAIIMWVSSAPIALH